MANINAALPTAIAIPFHPPTEALQHDNLIKPVIPKTEVIASYTKLREDDKKNPFSNQRRTFIQDENNQNDSNGNQQPQLRGMRRRFHFFSKRSVGTEEHEEKALEVAEDFKLALSVIQARYQRAVNPIADPNIDYAI